MTAAANKMLQARNTMVRGQWDRGKLNELKVFSLASHWASFPSGLPQ